MDALLVVDVQRDFCPGGALAAEGGARIIPAINRAIARAHASRWPIYASRDWHPPVTSHFRAYGGDWPPHCVQGTPGAAFHPDLQLPAEAIVITKGQDPGAAGYSAFEGRTPEGRWFAEDLRARGVTRLFVTGIATDYCVKASALDARREGLDVAVLRDAVTGIDVQAGDVERAVEAMRAAGVTLQQS
jgi:nicotinamidase/pyrazinamidase